MSDTKNIFLKADSCILGDFGLLLRLGDVTRVTIDNDNLQIVPAMAINYRSPELVVYHRGGTEPTNKSDVFQLGLVAAELFTGRNPLQIGGSLENIVIQPFNVGGEFGFNITPLIQKMLRLNALDRPSAFEALSDWQELYRTLLQRRHKRRNM